jgi:GH25 family lysozyme M1 (1,4-beta-N-acetylmuramidase)
MTMTNPRLDGHDTYHGNVWYDTVAACAHDLVIIKATQGIGVKDETFPIRWQAIRDHSVTYRVAYWWPQPNFALDRQFALFAQRVEDNGGLRPGESIMADVEHTEHLADAGYLTRAQVEEALTLMEATYPDRGMIYCNRSGFGGFEAWRAANPLYPLVYAHWPTFDPVSLGRAWDAVARYNATIWQFTNGAVTPNIVAGIAGRVDGDMIINHQVLDRITRRTTSTPTEEPDMQVITNEAAMLLPGEPGPNVDSSWPAGYVKWMMMPDGTRRHIAPAEHEALGQPAGRPVSNDTLEAIPLWSTGVAGSLSISGTISGTGFIR